jgi:4-methyl-5(b-hydroxyethyl)-thiazole monophosphate biosynthesis
MKALMIITNGFEEVEAVGTIGIFRRAHLEMDVASLHEHSAKGRFGVVVSELKNIKEINPKNYDCLIIPGGPEYVEFEASKEVKDLILYFHNNNKYIAAICAAPTILGHMGLLKGKNYVCFKSMNEDFGGTFIDQYSVVDGKLITGISAAGTIDFALNIVEALGGKELKEKEITSIYYRK